MELNRVIDHTLLAPAAVDAAFEAHLDEAVEYNFYSVCVSPYIALPTVRALENYPDTKVCTVVGFPHGNIPLTIKLGEADYFIQGGVHEIDWVLHYGEALNGEWPRVSLEMGQMARQCRDAGVVSKCIVEASYFPSKAMLVRLYQTARDAGVDFIKTSTGYGPRGARLETVDVWNRVRGLDKKPYIKAAGGIRNLDEAKAFLAAGADRLGSSGSVGIMEEHNQRLKVGGESDGSGPLAEGEEKAGIVSEES